MAITFFLNKHINNWINKNTISSLKIILVQFNDDVFKSTANEISLCKMFEFYNSHQFYYQIVAVSKNPLECICVTFSFPCSLIGVLSLFSYHSILIFKYFSICTRYLLSISLNKSDLMLCFNQNYSLTQFLFTIITAGLFTFWENLMTFFLHVLSEC